MTKINSIAFALDPTNVTSFLLDWELTKLCNLDCSYCSTGISGGHDNTTKHPSLAECLKSIDFMYEYVDQYMKYKKPTQRKVILNVYGGESLFHPDIVEILQACRDKYKQYKNHWYLTITCTTNGVVGEKRWSEVEPLGYLSESDKIINTLKTQLDTGTMPIIQCVKDICLCGICTPKAETREDFMELIKRNVPVDVFAKPC